MKILWRRIDHPGFEWCQIIEGRKGKSIQTSVFISYEGTICEIDYGIECSPARNTKSVTIHGAVDSRKVDIGMTVDSKQRWYENGKHAEQVYGCIDVDLGFSPSTNLLPIRRLKLRPGEPSKVTAAWVEFPSFGLRPLAVDSGGLCPHRSIRSQSKQQDCAL